MSKRAKASIMGARQRAVFAARTKARRAFEASLTKDRDKASPAPTTGGRFSWEGDVLQEDARADRSADACFPDPLRISVELALAKALDGAIGLGTGVEAGDVVLVDAPDPQLFETVRVAWRPLVLGENARLLHLDKVTPGDRRTEYDAAAIVLPEPQKAREAASSERAALTVLSWALPIVGISPLAPSHMPAALLAAARHRLSIPPLGADILARTITLVSGKRCEESDLDGLSMPLGAVDLAIAVRFDRSPAQCVAELVRLQRMRGERRGSRELALAELHGLDPAVDWARRAIADLAMWRRGAIPWSAVDHGIVLDGPPGTGKTLFAQVFADEAKLPLVAASLAKWQAAGHLGDLLKAMRADFNLARSKAPAVIFIDEVDTFPDRSKVKHDHKDYVIECVNGFIELLDGVEGRDGLIFIAASNDISRCDPAIIRAGRLNRIIRVELPDAAARCRMLRVRLGADLPDADLDRIARFAAGSSGADIERLVNDARRAARQANRPLAESDLVLAVAGQDAPVSPDLVRTAVHEAGHALAIVVLTGSRDFSVSLRPRQGAEGWVEHNRTAKSGTRSVIEAEIALLLAGGIAEEVVLGEASAGRGGVPGSDLAQATRLAAAMVGCLGQAGPHPLLFLSPLYDPGTVLAVPSLRAAVVGILERAEGRVRDLLGRHRADLDRIVARLLDERHLDGMDVARSMAGTGPAADGSGCEHGATSHPASGGADRGTDPAMGPSAGRAP